MKLEDFHKLDKRILKSQIYYDQIDISYIFRNYVISLYRTRNNKGNKIISLNRRIIYRFIKSSIKTFPCLFRMKNIWVFSNSERRKKIGEFYYDRVASIVSENNKDILYVENTVLVNHKKPTKDIILSDAIFYIGSFITSVFLFKKKKLYIEKELLKDLEKYEINPNIETIIKRFIGQYRFMRFFLKYIYKPDLVFSVYPNGYYGYNYAFKEFGIPIVELQHGIIYPLHPSYNSTLKKKDELFKPDYIFTYGIRDKMTIDKLSYVAKQNCYVVGSYGLWKVKQDKIEASKYLRNNISSHLKTLIIVATINDIDELYNFCIRLELLENNLNILLLPRHKNDDLLDTERIKILDVNKTNIFEVYKVADFLLTKSSTSALEALFMHIPTFILESEKKSIFRENYSFIKSFNYINSEVQLIDQLLNDKFKKPQKDDIEQIYSEDVINNFNSAINNVIRENNS